MLDTITSYWQYALAFLIFLIFLKVLFPPILRLIKKGIIQLTLLFLNKDDYKVIKNLKLNHNSKNDSIDYFIISKFGLFTINIKNYKGTVKGREHAEYWKQQISSRRYKVNNPIQQTSENIESLRAKYNINDDVFIPIIIFTSATYVKTTTRFHIIKYNKLRKTIKKHKKCILDTETMKNIHNNILSSQ